MLTGILSTQLPQFGVRRLAMMEIGISDLSKRTQMVSKTTIENRVFYTLNAEFRFFEVHGDAEACVKASLTMV